MPRQTAYIQGDYDPSHVKTAAGSHLRHTRAARGRIGGRDVTMVGRKV